MEWIHVSEFKISIEGKNSKVFLQCFWYFNSKCQAYTKHGTTFQNTSWMCLIVIENVNNQKLFFYKFRSSAINPWNDEGNIDNKKNGENKVT